ncbi:RNA polymerase sigma factor [Alienimonas californiensis]|uniref:Uncharacterized protein n=1 Tax=Alienimonas californiensis TaxID=2527989 RepID=A0A517P8N3_9PLAN|nr:hypothetical protein [Alienimonas californiensis]QDT15739.1 hypothetical protein CA12_18310 [Alienimonas californiensis]
MKRYTPTGRLRADLDVGPLVEKHGLGYVYALFLLQERRLRLKYPQAGRNYRISCFEEGLDALLRNPHRRHAGPSESDTGPKLAYAAERDARKLEHLKAEPVPLEDVVPPTDDRLDPAEGAELREAFPAALATLRTALLSLSPRFQTALLMHSTEGPEAAAVRLGVKPRQLRGVVRQAREALSACEGVADALAVVHWCLSCGDRAEFQSQIAGLLRQVKAAVPTEVTP